MAWAATSKPSLLLASVWALIPTSHLSTTRVECPHPADRTPGSSASGARFRFYLMWANATAVVQPFKKVFVAKEGECSACGAVGHVTLFPDRMYPGLRSTDTGQREIRRFLITALVFRFFFCHFTTPAPA